MIQRKLKCLSLNWINYNKKIQALVGTKELTLFNANTKYFLWNRSITVNVPELISNLQPHVSYVITLHPTQRYHWCLLIIPRTKPVLFTHASPSSMSIFEFKFIMNTRYFGRVEQYHMMQVVDCCELVPSMQISWTITSINAHCSNN